MVVKLHVHVLFGNESGEGSAGSLLWLENWEHHMCICQMKLMAGNQKSRIHFTSPPPCFLFAWRLPVAYVLVHTAVETAVTAPVSM